MKNKVSLLILLFPIFLFYSCKEEVIDYKVNTVEIESDVASKTKPKTDEQYISILYANLFQQGLGVDNLVEISDVIASVGDKDLVYEQIVSNFMNREDVLLPNDSLMRNDPSSFIDESYERFFVREASSLEKEFFLNYIESHPDINVEHVYFAFCIANEYRFY